MRQIAVFAGVLLAGASAFAADSQLLNLVMPNAQVMAGVNVTTAEGSPLGQYLLAQVGSNDKGLQGFIAATGFDPRKDVAEILVASPGNSASPSGLILAKGTFDVMTITAAVSNGTRQQVSAYDGYPLITSTDPKANHALAFIGNSIALAGDVTSVKVALDQSSGVNSVDPALAALVQSLSTSEDAWSASIASLGSLLPAGAATQNGNAAQILQLVKNIQSSSGGVQFGPNVVFNGQAVADTPQDAAAVANLIGMVSALVSMGAAQNPQTGAAAQLLQNLQVTTTGATVNLAASIPEAQIEAALKSVSAHNSAEKPKTRRL
ncbi:MAG: hypothetical protein ABSB15_01230 [Bryobacteraceae bacterium]|jgi:hypothetical protein